MEQLPGLVELAKQGGPSLGLSVAIGFAWVIMKQWSKSVEARVKDLKAQSEVLTSNATAMAEQARSAEVRNRAAEAQALAITMMTTEMRGLRDEVIRLRGSVP